MKLSDVIEIWEHLHIWDTGELGFSDLERAIDKVVGVENDIVTASTVTISSANPKGENPTATQAGNTPFSLTH